MKHKLFVFIVLLFAVVSPSKAQITQINLDADNHSIIRTVDDLFTLIYCETSSSEGWFLLKRTNEPVARAFQVPAYFQVRDVRVHNGVAYLCGTIFGGNFGLLGTFDILSVFLGSGQVYYGYSDFYYTPIITYSMKATDLKRLDLFNVGDTVCMAMAGSSITDLGIQVASTTVVSAWHDSTGWHANAAVNKGNFVRFTDIACLRNVVMAVGSDTNGTGCFLKAYHPSLNFPANEFSHDLLHRIDFMSPVGDVLALRLSNDSMAVAHFDNESGVRTVLHRFRVSDATGVPSYNFNCWLTEPAATTPYNSNWKMYELANVEDTTWILQWADYGTGLSPQLSKFPMSCPAPTADLWRPVGTRWKSMDLDCPNAKPCLSGNNPYLNIQFSAWNTTSGNCTTHATHSLKCTTAGLLEAFMADDNMDLTIIPWTDTPAITTLPAEILCNE